MILHILYSVPIINSVPAVKISIKIHEDPEICDLDDHKEQSKVDTHISANTLAEYDNSPEGY